MNEDIIFISVAPNGARKTKDLLPNIPISIEEIAIEAEKCRDAGAALFHLHIRDESQKHLLDAQQYKDTITAIREKVGDELIIQATTEAVEIYSPEEQIALIKDLKPEATSVAIRELVPSPEYEKQAGEFFAYLNDNNIFTQYILYSPEEIAYFAELKEKGIIPDGRNFVLFVLGKKHAAVNDTNSFATPKDLYPFLDTYNKTLADKNVIWAICSFGGNENACMLEAAKNNGNVRIGFENNHLMADGSIADSNAALILQFVESLGSSKKVATATEMRDFFGASYNNHAEAA